MVEDTTVASRNVASGTTLRVNVENYFKDNRVAQSNYDANLQWCHNSIYNYIEGNNDFTYDDCVPGTATCCHCNDTTRGEVDITAAPSSASRMVSSLVGAVMFATWMLV